MFARLWWKETRQIWPVWAFLACVGLGLHVLIRVLTGPKPIEAYLAFGQIVTMIYLFLIPAAAFAGERESGTLTLLDALPVDRLRLWVAKASFALVTTLAMGILIWLSSLVMAQTVPDARAAELLGRALPLWLWWGLGALVWGLMALGWGLLWSTLLGNAMHAAILAMASTGASLLALVNLQSGLAGYAEPTLKGVVMANGALIGVALATAAASAFAFVRNGPPGRARRGARPIARPVARPAVPAIEPAGDRRLPRAWPYATGRLAWETLRQIRANLGMLLAAVVGSVVYVLLTEWDRAVSGLPLLFLAMAILGVMTGVAAFNAENRGGTRRFLDQHGARPGVVWGVKVLLWWIAAAVLWLLVLLPLIVQAASQPDYAQRLQTAWQAGLATGVASILAALTIPFAAGALCGMVFRRGITAGAMAVVLLIALAALLAFPLTAGIMRPSAAGYVSLALLAVTWAWSGDWLRFAPGLGKWGRLALWCGAAAAILVPGYIAGRAWDAPALPADQARALFQPERFGQPSPPDDDAAPLYWEAERMILAAGEPGRDPKWGSRWLSQVQREPPSDPKVAAWLEKVEPALAILREAARRPNCVYEDLGKATIASTPPQPYEENLTTPLIVSAAAKLDRGDLDGSWEEVETLLRMARQYSTVRTWSYSPIETQAVAQAFRWAADSRQTADSLERALAAYRSLPPGDTPADRVRVERIVFQNTLDLPPGDLVDIALRLVHGQSRKVSTIDALQARAMTTPWEIARARKVFDLMAASWIETLRAESGSGARPRMARLDSRFALPRGVTIQYADGSSRRVEPLELLELSSFTPLVQRALLAGTAVNRGGEPFLSILTDRRALAMVLRLRLHQARHDGALPESLDELPPPGGAVGGVDLEAMDPFGQGRFGYLPSTGQRLVPLEDAAYQGWFFQQGNPSPRVPTDGSRLLYSVGPDRVDGRAADNLDLMQRGDVVFPLKDGVKPPPAGSS